MRLPDEPWCAILKGVAVALAGVGLMPGAALARPMPPAPALPEGMASARTGPAADYPVVVGPPYRVGDHLFTPIDTMNYDTVGYARIEDPADGAARVSAAHHVLPVPCYVEVTALDSGRTIVLRVDRRGPMDSMHELALSPAAAAQLGIAGDAPVRVRRVSPMEGDRAMLRLGQGALPRMDTPAPLLAVLRRRLDHAEPPHPAEQHDEPIAAVAPPPPLLPPPPAPLQAAPRPAAASAAARLVVQIGAFAHKPRATALAARLQASLSPVGRLWRVRLGPYATRRQAQAALDKVKAAGYTDSRIQRTD